MRRRSKQDQTISGRGVGINNSCSSVLPAGLARLLAGAHGSSPGSTAPCQGGDNDKTQQDRTFYVQPWDGWQGCSVWQSR